MKFIGIIFSLFTLFSACQQKKIKQPDSKPDLPNEKEQNEFVIIDYPINQLEKNINFERSIMYGGKIESTTLNEASGIAISHSNPYILWSHNDSGHPNRIHALGRKGEDYGTYSLIGIGSRDYEDIAIGVGPQDSVSYLYVADIGDNDAKYNYIVIYRFPEPNIKHPEPAGRSIISENEIERLEFAYPDGPRDAETLMIDPWTKDLYIVTKRDFKSVVYRAKYPQSTTQRTTLEKLAQLPFNWALSGDISQDGTQIVIKDKTRIFYWTRHKGESVIDALRKPPTLLPYILEPQGEAIGWSPDGKSYFTLSEKSGHPQPELYYYQKK